MVLSRLTGDGGGAASETDMPGGTVRLSFPVYFVRHGQTDWNAARRFQGHTDVPLNDVGRGQARRNGRRLACRLFTPESLTFYASPLSRATETLEIMLNALGMRGASYETDERLIEIDLGDWNGKTPQEINSEDPGVFEEREKDKWRYVVPGGESYENAADRTRAFLEELRGPCLIAGHGASGRLLRGYLTGMARDAVPLLKAPQDKVFRLSGGREAAV
ncbi:MAG: histidine phosphatase family protein [Pseudomonadota bacterium]